MSTSSSLQHQLTTYNGRRYRVCVYPTSSGWAGFAESSRFYLGSTGVCSSRRAAGVAAARLVAADGSGVSL